MGRESSRPGRGGEALGGCWPCTAHVIPNCNDGPVSDCTAVHWWDASLFSLNSLKLPFYSFTTNAEVCSSELFSGGKQLLQYLSGEGL